MASRGWVFNFTERRYELRGDAGEVVGWVTCEMIDRGLLEAANRFGAARRHPPLDPAAPWWVCHLAGGPLDGLTDYLDPAVYETPPEVLCVAVPEPVPWPVPGDTVPRPDPAGELYRVEAYRRQMQLGGLGRAFPYPYSWDRGRW